MKLTEAIAFATNHNNFKQFLKARRINEDTANGLYGRVLKYEKQFVWVEVIIDYGKQGKSGNDIRIIVFYDNKKGNFNFRDIHFAGPRD